MDFTNLYQVSSFLLVEAVKIRYMLEVVCIHLATLYNLIRKYIIIELGNFKIPSLLSKC